MEKMKGLKDLPVENWINTIWKFSHLDLSDGKIGYCFDDGKFKHTITWYLLDNQSNIFFDEEDFDTIYENFMNSKGFHYDKQKL